MDQLRDVLVLVVFEFVSWRITGNNRADVIGAKSGRIARVRAGDEADFLALAKIFEIHTDDRAAMKEDIVVTLRTRGVLDESESLF